MHFGIGIILENISKEKRNLRLSDLKLILMLYLLAVILLIGWILGFFVFSAGSFIHILLVIAIVAILLRVIRGDRAL